MLLPALFIQPFKNNSYIMRIKNLLTTACFLAGFASPIFAQIPEGAGPNLVPNPSFEDRKPNVSLPKDDADGSAAFRLTIADWLSPTYTTPDWIIIPQSKVAEAKRKGQATNEAHTGFKMVGILTHNPKSERSDTYREYIQVKLTTPTKPNKEYYFEFWACIDHNSKFASNNLGIFLSPAPITRNDAGNKWAPILDIVPDKNHSDVINEKKREWVRISGTVTPTSSCNFLIIGNFFDNNATIMKEINSAGIFENSYYLIDDVALHEVKPEPPKAEPEPEPEVIPPPTLAEEPMEVGKKIELDHVYFETAKWKLLEQSSTQLDELVVLMSKHPTMEIEIGGHTDSRGSDSDNQKLSENRTRSVYEYLIGKGVDKTRMAYKGYGEKQPKTDNDTEEGRAQNRRVEFTVLKIDSPNTEVIIKDEKKDYQGGDK
jgi:OmpA-OmpF porin, OOP family